MRKLLPQLFGTMLLLGVSSAPVQEKKPPTTLEEDWKTLCRFQWVNSDPKEAWAQLDAEWKKSYTRQGAKGWSRIELSFKDGRPDKKEYRMSASWYYIDGKGKEQTLPVLYRVFFAGLREENGDRFLLLGGGKAKIKYVLKDRALILNGVNDSSASAMLQVYTGTSKGLEGKEKK
jgi:hypothetical protein